ncbi:MAG: sensor histidine kinase [Deltaproteobacteria bacterium]|nr:sensor histidine kinase [Deltaproteobacteria bacterium]
MRKANIPLWVVVCGLLWAWATTPVIANPLADPPPDPPTLVLTQQTSSVLVVPFAQMLEDPAGTLTLDDVRSPALAGHWSRPTGSTINLGLVPSILWVRFSLVNQSEESTWELNVRQNQSRQATLYIVEGTTVRGPFEAGLSAPLEARSIPDRVPRYLLSLAQNHPQTFYIRVHTLGYAGVNPLLSRLPQAAHFSYSQKLLIGLYTGLVLAMLFYNLLIGVSLGDKRYLFYGLYLVSLSTFLLLLYGLFETLWPWNFTPRQVEGVGWAIFGFGFLSILTLLLFTGHFFNAWKHRTAGRVLKGWLVVSAGAALVGVFLPLITAYRVFNVLLILTQGVVLFVSVFYLWRGDRTARFFTAALLPEMAGMVVGGLTMAGWLPNNYFTLFAALLGGGSEILIFSLALADRYNLLRQEKETSEQHARQVNENLRQSQRENEEMKAEVERREAVMKELEKTTAMKDKFVSLVAHDIRSPFNSMLTEIQYALRDAEQPLPPEQREIFQGITDFIGKQIVMVENLLNLNRLQSGSMTPEIQDLDGWELAEETLMFNHLARQKGLRLENQVPKGTRLRGDRDLIREVLQNLVINAIKFTPQGGRIRVYVPQGPGSRLAVEDNGRGVHPAFLPHLFDPAEKTTSRGTAGEQGSGLGLPLCHEIMAAHGGTLTVESSPGKGCCFVLTLPAPSLHRPPEVH